MPAFGLNRYGMAFAEAVSLAGTRLNDRQLTAVDILAGALWVWGLSKPLETSFRFVYPFVGGSAVAHSFNLANPNTGRITWAGTITHDSTGVKGDGTTGLGVTGITIAGTTLAFTYLSVGVYSRTNNTGTFFEIGNAAQPPQVGGNTATAISIACNWTDNLSRVYNGNWDASITPNYADSRGLFSSLRTSSTNFTDYRNGVAGNNSTVAAPNPPSTPGVFNVLGDATTKSNRNLSFAFLTNASNFAGIGAINTTAKQGTLYTLVQKFQTQLLRQV
jgi:hypothetical protein